jgi:hypothetical protein
MNEGYELIPLNPEKGGTFFVKIVADSNDADYITEEFESSKEEFETSDLKELKRLQNKFGGHYKLENYDGDLPIPCSEYGRCHSLERIEVRYMDENGVLYDVKIKY